MRRPHRYAIAQHPAAFGIGLGRFELKFRAIEFIGYLGGVTEAPRKPIDPRSNRGAAFQKTAPRPPRACKFPVIHDVSLPLRLFRYEPSVLYRFKYHRKIRGVTCLIK